MAEHSPTPWRIEDRGAWCVVLDSDGKGALWVDPAGADAAFAVRAVNAHEALVEALDAVIGAVCKYLPPDGIDKDELINRVIHAVDNKKFVADFRLARGEQP
jgi:hypothetical protein